MAAFLTGEMGWEQEEGGVLPNLKEYGNFVVLANKEHGILIAPNVAQFVAMEGNALYNQTAAAREAHTLVTEPGRCPADLIRYLFEHHLLPDAVLPADDTGEILHANWDFLARLYLQSPINARMLWHKGKSGIFVVIKFIEDMAIRKYAMAAAMALALMPGGLKAQVTSQDVAAAVGQGVVDFLEGRGTWIPDRPGYFNSGGLVYKNVSTSMVRQLSEAIVWRIDVQPEGVLHIPDDINVGFDRFHVSGFAEGAFEYGHMTAIDLPHREFPDAVFRVAATCNRSLSIAIKPNLSRRQRFAGVVR